MRNARHRGAVMKMEPCPTCDAWTNTPCAFGSCGGCHQTGTCQPIAREQGTEFTAPLIYPREGKDRQ